MWRLEEKGAARDAQLALWKDFRTSTEIFDSARDQVVPYSRRASYRQQLNNARDDIDETQAGGLDERSDLSGCEPYTIETFGEHCQLMDVLTDTFCTMSDKFDLIPESCSDHEIARKLFGIEAQLYCADAQEFAVAADFACQDALAGQMALLQRERKALFDKLSNDDDLALSDDDDRQIRADKPYFEKLGRQAEIARDKAAKYIELAGLASELAENVESPQERGLSEEYLGTEKNHITTEKVNQYVARSMVATVLSTLVYVGLVLWLAPRLRGLAVVIFWIGAVGAGLGAIQLTLLVLSSLILFTAMRFGYRSEDNIDTSLSGIIRAAGLVFLIGAVIYLYPHVYPHSWFLGF